MQELNAAIPGMSLTGTPKGRPHERPPQFTDPEDALQLHLANLSRPEVLESVFDALDMGMDVRTITEGVLRMGVAGGRHTTDVSLIIAPVIHEFIRSNADAAGVKFEDGFDKPQNKEAKKAKTSMRTDRALEAMKLPEKKADVVPPPVEEPKNLGLAQRRK
jgi:hypothetical protein